MKYQRQGQVRLKGRIRKAKTSTSITDMTGPGCRNGLNEFDLNGLCLLLECRPFFMGGRHEEENNKTRPQDLTEK